MKLQLYKNKDVLTGVMLIAIGCAGVWMARDYRFGRSLRMGPGYFPTVLGWLIVAFGVGIGIKGLISQEKVTGPLSFRAFIVLPMAIVLFGLLMQYAGFVPACCGAIFLSAMAGRDFKFREILMLALLLTVAAVALFVYGLSLPYPLIKGV